MLSTETSDARPVRHSLKVTYVYYLAEGMHFL
jgi:hypothetical protein